MAISILFAVDFWAFCQKSFLASAVNVLQYFALILVAVIFQIPNYIDRPILHMYIYFFKKISVTSVWLFFCGYKTIFSSNCNIALLVFAEHSQESVG